MRAQLPRHHHTDLGEWVRTVGARSTCLAASGSKRLTLVTANCQPPQSHLVSLILNTYLTALAVPSFSFVNAPSMPPSPPGTTSCG